MTDKDKILIRGGRIIDPGNEMDITGDIIVIYGRVTYPSDGTDGFEGTVIDAAGLVVCPGFVDLHSHLRQPGFEEKETIASGTAAAARGGFTTVACMPNTEPPLDNAGAIDYVNTIAASEGKVRVLPIGCVSKERKGKDLAELAEMAGAGAVGFSDDGSPVADAGLMRQALEYSLICGRPIINHCEELSLAAGGQMNEGIVATRLGLPGIPRAAEEVMVARDLTLAELTGARLHLAHVSTAGSVELIRAAKERGVPVTAEVTPHHLTLTEKRVLGYDTSTKVNPPLRAAADIAALIRGLNEDVIDIIATDHAPHAEIDKLCEFGFAPFGISGLETALGSLMELVHRGELPLERLIAKLTCAPAVVIGRTDLGNLKEGAAADITVFDPDREWTVDTSQFASKGKNTPLAGETLRGKVMATIYQGKLVHRDEALKIE
jgi:dihydroorotase